MSLINNIKNIITDYIDNYYTNYLKENKILKIDEDTLDTILNDIYDTNSKNIKSIIRNKLKEMYKDDYPSASVENIIFDIFQDKDLSIQKIKEEIINNQNRNKLDIILPIYNNSLNMKINIVDNFILITDIDTSLHTQENYDTIKKYKFIYSINDIVLDKLNNKEKIETIKKLTSENTSLKLQLYFLL